MIRVVDRSSCSPAWMPPRCAVTKVPAPCRTRSIPLSTRRATALRTVGRLTPYSVGEVLLGGEAVPGLPVAVGDALPQPVGEPGRKGARVP